jgi:urease accessory protein
VKHATAVQAVGTWRAQDAVGVVTLDWDHRHRRRITLALDGGGEILLDLAQTAVLHEGDGLVLDGGGIILVRAKAEAVCDVACATPAALARIAWHLGNRHLPVEVLPAGLRIRDDHVIVAMLEGLGAVVVRATAPFTPEGGAYDQAQGPAHDHVHAPGQAHGHGHADAHDHAHGDHEHGHGHRHGYDHHH